jgi:ubiquinone/menaquinone biosynthesis C-methylase UbiE
MRRSLVLALLVLPALLLSARAQDQSVRPGINQQFAAPNPGEFVARFEVESREVFAKRAEIVAACEIKPGAVLADVGAGTGLFTRLFSPLVGDRGRVLAVDIAQPFLDHITLEGRKIKQTNVETILCTADDAKLPPDSVDLVFICDTYHHFEFPQKTLASLLRAMKPGARLIVIDFERIPGKSSDFVLGHVRAGRDVFETEITSAGFKKLKQVPGLLEENYFLVFEKPAAQP